MRVAALVWAWVVVTSCSADPTEADPGVAASGGNGGSAGESGTGGGWPDASAGAGGAEPVDPGPPSFPATIDRLTIAVRTGTGENDGTDDNAISVCLTSTHCFTLAVAGADDFENGDFGVYHFEGVDLPRSEVDRVEIRSSSGPDAWRPACLQIQFDGEPVHCEEEIDVWIGTDATDNSIWTDPAGLHSACTSCYPAPLTHGPMLGATSAESARIWLRTDATRRVKLALTEPESRVIGYAYPLPERDYTSVFDLAGLAPSTSYTYAIEVEGGDPVSGQLTTAPALGSAGKTRIAVGSCAQQTPRPDKGLGDGRPIFAQIEKSAPDLMLFVGDNVYADYIQKAPDLATFRYHYRRAVSFPEQLAVVGRVPTLAIWDDHDFAGNNTDNGAPNKQQGYRAFQEFWANPSFGTPDAPGVFHAFSWGDVDVFMLDVRYHRSPDPKGTFDDDGTVLGDGQMQWLKQELAKSTATFKLIASGTLFSYTGTSDQAESWAEYPKARDELLDFIRDQQIGGVVLVAGDIHRSVFRKVLRQSAGSYDLPELVSSPLRNTAGSCPTPYSDAEQVDCVGGLELFMTLDIDTTLADPTLTARLIDDGGQVHATWTIARSTLE